MASSDGVTGIESARESVRLENLQEEGNSGDKSRPASQADLTVSKMPSRLSSYGANKSPRSQSRAEENYSPRTSSFSSAKPSKQSPQNSGKTKQRSGSLQNNPPSRKGEVEVVRPKTRSGSAKSVSLGSAKSDDGRIRPGTVTKGRVAKVDDEEAVDDTQAPDDTEVQLPVDDKASEVISKILGSEKKIIQPENTDPTEPSEKPTRQVSAKVRSNNVEYTAAFSSRPKIPRTPDLSQPDRIPTPTHSTGVPTQSRPTSAFSDKHAKTTTSDGQFKKPSSKSSSRPSSKK
ncbi:uncharacterized protein TRIADDRAFT_57603 [Trichoplax adhaerens]|uniref:Uncharacterized protein n=1 Tax=Trichoplax adhaerens TaxID=10228 RepID=B3RZW9_TRIAD|nr:predicted protein [Trichoplax adhaerens]EDV24285.1 predicted protein [Trichoplax adhaerens]|eukprot:XP_002113811.1 predicted protein [Trichoplax adhaerens]